MISLSPGSLCDVCAEEYGPHNYPHSIPCGHILCLHCCNNILEKTPQRLTPCCPFCRVPFTSDTIRLIRVDFNGGSTTSSGWSTPRAPTDFPDPHGLNNTAAGDDDVLLLNLNPKAEARRLESKVAKVASKKCSAEEVRHLHDELRKWLSSDVKGDDQSASLRLSAALLHAILINHAAHKHVEADLKAQLEEVHTAKDQLESELQRMSAQYAAKAQEIQTLHAEMSRFKIKAAAPLLGVPATPPPTTLSSASAAAGLISPTRPQSSAAFAAGTRSGATSPTSPTSPTRSSYTPALQMQTSLSSPVSRASAASGYAHGHTRSASTVPAHRSMTPAARPSSAIPVPRTSATPAPRSAIPHNTTSATTGTLYHASIMTKARVMSPPPKMTRSSSGGASGASSGDEKEKARESAREKDRQRVQLIQRWIPTVDPAASSPPFSGKDSFQSRIMQHAQAGIQTGGGVATAPPPRYKTPLSVRSP